MCENFSKHNSRLEKGLSSWASSPVSSFDASMKEVFVLSSAHNYAKTNARYKKHISCVNFIKGGRKQRGKKEMKRTLFIASQMLRGESDLNARHFEENWSRKKFSFRFFYGYWFSLSKLWKE